MLVSENKIDSCFPDAQFKINGFIVVKGFISNQTSANSNIPTNQLWQVFEMVNDAFCNHASIKRRCVRVNQRPFMNMTLEKDVITRLKFLKNRTEADETSYKKQRNLFRKEKINFLENSDTKNMTDIKQFWKTIKEL